MTIVTRLSEKLGGAEKEVTCCGYGVGLSWAILNMKVTDIIIPEIILMSNDEKDIDHLA